MAALNLRFFGQFQVTRAERLITAFESDKGRALLTYLAVEAAQAHSRSALTALLWPEYTETSARGSLRQALYQLRQVIGDDESASAYLLITRQTIQFNLAAPYQCDVTAFDATLQTVANHAHPQLAQCPTCLAQLRQAVELYQGEFLAGFAIADSLPFEEWRRRKQEQFHLQALDALTLLADAAEATGAWEQAQQYARRQLTLEPWREEAHRQLMRLLALQGQRPAAVAQYHTCRQVLQTELGVEPSAATTHLYEQIRAGLLPEQADPLVRLPVLPAPVASPPAQTDAVFAESAASITAEPARAANKLGRHNLPTQLTPFIGRVQEVEEIVAHLQQPDHRLLTLIGPGGMGKTRLALEVARTLLDHYADGVFFISLAPLTSTAALVPAIVSALELDLPGANLEKSLLHFLRAKQMLLILDNVEHLPDAASLASSLVQGAPGLQIMATSRARLSLQGEQLYSVQPLPFQRASSLEAGLATDAVRLFSQCARRVNPAFSIDAATLPVVLRICQLVEGMPLGLEMAAAQSEWLSLAEIAGEIETQRDFLAADWADAPARQRSMRAVFTWSWELLDAQDQQTFSRLSIFRGGFTREAATAITGAPLRSLMNLVNKSLLYVNATQPTAARYQVHELLRQFGAEQLDALPVERAEVEARHSAYYLAFLAEREERLARHEPQQAATEIQQELDNIRRAWAHAAATANVALLLTGLNALMRYYELTGLLNESIQEFRRVNSALQAPMLASPAAPSEPPAHQPLLSKLWAFWASALIKQGKFDEGMALAQRAIDMGQDHRGFEGEVYGWLVMGQGLYRKGKYDEARGRFAQTLRLVDMHRPHKASLSFLHDAEYMAYGWLGATESETGNFAVAKVAFDQCIAICRRLNHPRAEVQARINLANLLRRMSDYGAARTLYAECLQITHTLGYHWGESETLAELGDTLAMLGEYTLADEHFRQAENQLTKFGYMLEALHCTVLRARLYCYLGAYATVRQWLGRVLQNPLLQDSAWLTLIAHITDATLAYQIGDYRAVVDEVVITQQLSERLGTPLLQANGLLLLGHAHLALQQWAAAEQAYAQAHALYQQVGNLALGAETSAGLALVALAAGKPQQALAQVESLLPLLQNKRTVGLNEPFFVYLAAYRVLSAVGDQRAAAVLTTGYAELQRYAAGIADDALRQSFGEAVAVHRELQQLYAARQQPAVLVTPVQPARSAPTTYHWGEMPEVYQLYGREREAQQLEQWLQQPDCRVVTLYGIGGIGKTTLAAATVKASAPAFDVVIWRTLVNAPTVSEILVAWLQILSAQTITNPPATVDAQLELLLTYLRQSRALLVLDNLESILLEEGEVGEMRSGYEGYAQLLQQLSSTAHCSMLLLTSREEPKVLEATHKASGAVRTLVLSGLDGGAGQSLLQRRGLQATDQELASLVQHYSGNPLALQITATTIVDLFAGDVRAFQQEELSIFGGIRAVLDKQFARLSKLERDLMIWLAIEREAVTVAALRNNLVEKVAGALVVEALHALQKRSLLERTPAGLTLQNVIIEYTTEYLLSAVCSELTAAQGLEATALVAAFFNRFALVKAQAKEYVRQSQRRLIVQPLVERLQACWGKSAVATQINALLADLHAAPPRTPGYAAGNLLTLLRHWPLTCRGYDFSRLCVWGVDFRGAQVTDINFAEADLAFCTFTFTLKGFAIKLRADEELLVGDLAHGDVNLWVLTGNRSLMHAHHWHSNSANPLVFNDAGTGAPLLLAGAGLDFTIRVWSVDQQRQLHHLQGHQAGIVTLAINAGGTLLASGGEDQTICLWDLRSGQLLHRVSGQQSAITALAFAPPSADQTLDPGQALLFSGSRAGTLQGWAIQHGQLINTWRVQSSELNSLAVAPNHALLASGHVDGIVQLWDGCTGQALARLTGHSYRVNVLAFQPTSDANEAPRQVLASGADDHTVLLWEVQDDGRHQLRYRLVGHGDEVYHLAFSPDGRRLASASAERCVRLWDTQTGRPLETLLGHLDMVGAARFSPDGRLLASGSGDGIVRLWALDPVDVARRAPEIVHYCAGHTGRIQAIAFSSDGRLLASAGADQTIALWEVASGRLLQTLVGHTGPVLSLAFHPTQPLLASGGADHTIRLWTPAGNTWRAAKAPRWSGHPARVLTLAFHPAGDTLVSGSEDHTLCLWDMQCDAPRAVLTGHTAGVNSVAVSADGQIIASSSSDYTLRLWQADTGAALGVRRGDRLGGRVVAIAADSELIAYGAEELSIEVWHVRTGQVAYTLRGHTSTVVTLAFSPVAPLLLSGGWDGTLRLWDLRTGDCLHTLRAPGPYAGMNITRVTGISDAQKVALKALGAVEE